MDRKVSSHWQEGYGVIGHGNFTCARAQGLISRICQEGRLSQSEVLRLFWAADRLANAAMWLVVHMSYASRISMKEALVAPADFKRNPEGHVGGSLNMVPAYVGYLLANALMGKTRAWMMGQGHCVAAIEAVNVLTGNMHLEQAQRYSADDAGLTRLVRDFYSYEVDSLGRPAAPLGSHVNAHTAGGISEGGYLGFAELQYVHAPLKGESLVAFLSDGAFEEQRGSDWSPRWWRAEDCGHVMPIMILNGRRIEERSEISQDGGSLWLRRHLRNNGFDPIEIDGHDPVSFACAIIEMEDRLDHVGTSIINGSSSYPAKLPYGIAITEKGFGFPGAGTNRAHNLPLEGNPALDAHARESFMQGAKALWVDPVDLHLAVQILNNHDAQQRVRERDNPLALRKLKRPELPVPTIPLDGPLSPMESLDRYFVDLVLANPDLRVRVANPDELASNHMTRTLTTLKHRVNAPEAGLPEAVDGKVITALNEEAVINAALANKGGLNLAVSYEAFAMKMAGAIRQEILFARHQREAGRPPGWIGMPLLVSSHAWENGKNEQSHQDTSIGEVLLGEMSDVSRVLFPIDAASAVAALRSIYSDRGTIGCLVTAKQPVAQHLDSNTAERLLQEGALHIAGSPSDASLQIVTIGAYQLREALRARDRLFRHGFRAVVTAIVEPGKLRVPRDALESRFVMADARLQEIFPADLPRIIVSHMRPEPTIGLLRRLDGGAGRTAILGYISQGGTLDTDGMLFANRCSWAQIVDEAKRLLNLRANLLDDEEEAAVRGIGQPRLLFH